MLKYINAIIAKDSIIAFHSLIPKLLTIIPLSKKYA
jgi:hypothetical protein